jgi:hypothetical protein
MIYEFLKNWLQPLFKPFNVNSCLTKSLNHLVTLSLFRSNFVDRRRFDANPYPDQIFHFETELDPDSDPQNTVKFFEFSTRYPYLFLQG